MTIVGNEAETGKVEDAQSKIATLAFRPVNGDGRNRYCTYMGIVPFQSENH